MIVYAAKDLGALIRDRRGQLHLTQQALAARVGVSRAWIVALEKGKSSAQVGLVLQTLRELDLTLQVEAGAPGARSGRVDLNDLIARYKRHD